MKQAASALERRELQNVARFRTFADVAFGPRQRVFTPVVGPSRTKQSFIEECDINVLMRRYQASGVLPPMDGREARYLDCSSVDYQAAMLVVAGAKSAFAALPATLRDRFKNDPNRLLEFLDDDRNREEAVKLGLVNPPKEDAKPLEVRVVADAVPVVKEPIASAPDATAKRF